MMISRKCNWKAGLVLAVLAAASGQIAKAQPPTHPYPVYPPKTPQLQEPGQPLQIQPLPLLPFTQRMFISPMNAAKPRSPYWNDFYLTIRLKGAAPDARPPFTVRAGEPVLLDIAVRNTLAQKRTFVLSGMLRQGAEAVAGLLEQSVKVTDANGNPAPMTERGRRANTMAFPAKTSFDLEGGEEQHFTVDAATLYDIKRPGVYLLRVSFQNQLQLTFTAPGNNLRILPRERNPREMAPLPGIVPPALNDFDVMPRFVPPAFQFNMPMLGRGGNGLNVMPDPGMAPDPNGATPLVPQQQPNVLIIPNALNDTGANMESDVLVIRIVDAAPDQK